MKITRIISVTLTAVFVLSLIRCGNPNPASEKESQKVDMRSETVSYNLGEVEMKGFASYDANFKKRPVILIIHEWWGLNDYAKNRAEQLSKLGYFVFAVDMYGDGKTANNPTDAGTMAMPFYSDPEMANERIQAALEKIKSYPQADLNKVVAIGYCFGGSMVLNAAKSGMDFKGVVSFHGGLAGVQPEKNKMKADILVCHGGADQFVPEKEVNQFKHQMDSVNANYTFKTYPNATHAFTNPDATEKGKKFNLPIAYNKKADEDSWKDFMAFLKELKMEN